MPSSARTNTLTGKDSVVLASAASICYDLPMMGNRLKEVLEREEVTAYRLWKDLGINQGQLSRFLSGKASMSLENLERIADYLGYDLALLKRIGPGKGGNKNGDHLQAKKRVLGKVLSRR